MLIAGVLAGSAAGLLVTLLQELGTTPLILEAETFETGAHGQGAEATELSRLALTLLANVVTAVGFGLLLAAGMALAGVRGLWQGLLWGLGGYLAWSLLPALGLPPEPPGVEAAELAKRQLWWVGTAVASSLGLLLLAFAPRRWLRPLGLLLLALPHLVGAPHLAEANQLVPAELVNRFILVSLLTAAVFWIFLGLATAALLRRSA